MVRGGSRGVKNPQKVGQEIRTRRSRDLKKIVIWKKIKKRSREESGRESRVKLIAAIWTMDLFTGLPWQRPMLEGAIYSGWK